MAEKGGALLKEKEAARIAEYEEAARKGEIYAAHKEALIMNEQYDKEKKAAR